MAAATLLIGAFISWRQYQANQHTDTPAPRAQTVSNSSAEAPPSTEKPKPSEFDSYTAPADLPRYLFIPKLSIRAMVKPMGLTASRQIEAPRNAFDVGWYNGSAKPGQTGAMFIDGHVSGGAVPGVFYDLKNLVAGDTFTLERGDGAVFTYKVIKTTTYPVDKVDMTAALTPITPGKPGLNLITCTGSVIKGTNNYDKRLIVFTEQL